MDEDVDFWHVCAVESVFVGVGDDHDFGRDCGERHVVDGGNCEVGVFCDIKSTRIFDLDLE